jgi:hypothetical protein
MDDIFNKEPFPLEIQNLLDDLHSGYVEKFEAAEKNLRDLSDANKQKATAIIKTALSHPNPERRCDAIELLLLIDPKKNFELVIPLLDDPVSYVRLCVCTEFEFNEMYSIELLDLMVKLLLNDSDSDVRYQAAFFLGRIGDDRRLANGQPGALPGRSDGRGESRDHPSVAGCNLCRPGKQEDFAHPSAERFSGRVSAFRGGDGVERRKWRGIFN